MTHTERRVQDCCPTCLKACEMTGYEGTVLKQPWIGTPVGKLESGDVVRSFRADYDGTHVFGVVTKNGRRTYVTWTDRTEPELLHGGMGLKIRKHDNSPFTATDLPELVA